MQSGSAERESEMIVSIDGGKPIEVLNDVKVIIGDGAELHVTVSHEGVVYDRVNDGEVTSTQRVRTDDILPMEEDDECLNCHNGSIGFEEGRMVCRGECGCDFGPVPCASESPQFTGDELDQLRRLLEAPLSDALSNPDNVISRQIAQKLGVV